MKIAVLNYSGSVGKTIVASHLLAPRLPQAMFFAVETTNETAADLGLTIDQMRGEQFGHLFRTLLPCPAAIIDVGASNIEAFLTAMTRYEGACEEIDYFVLPVIGTGKAQRETIKTMTALLNLGVASERILLLFNRVQSDVEEEFLALLTYVRKTASAIAHPQAVVYENEVFELLADARCTLAEVLVDPTDYRNLLRQTDPADLSAISQLTNRHALRALAKPVSRQLDDAFTALFGTHTATPQPRTREQRTQTA